MGKTVLLLVCLGVLIHTGSALLCYECKSDQREACVRGAPGLKSVPCGVLEHPNILRFCLSKVLYDKKLQKEIYTSSCEALQKPIGRDNLQDVAVPESIIVLDRNVQQCQPNVTHEVKKCEVCKTNFCNFFENSASFSKMNVLTLLYLLPFYFVTKFILS